MLCAYDHEHLSRPRCVFSLNNKTDCAVCGDGYVASLGFTCDKCSGNTKGIIVASIFAAVFVSVVVAIVWHLMSSETRGTNRGIVNYVTRRVPIQAVKIIIVAWQILTQVI